MTVRTMRASIAMMSAIPAWPGRAGRDVICARVIVVISSARALALLPPTRRRVDVRVEVQQRRANRAPRRQAPPDAPRVGGPGHKRGAGSGLDIGGPCLERDLH